MGLSQIDKILKKKNEHNDKLFDIPPIESLGAKFPSLESRGAYNYFDQ